MKSLRSMLSRITSISTPLGGIGWSPVNDEKPADLMISSLDGICGLTPLDGHPVINIDGKKIFTGGVRAEFILTHNQCGDSTILLRKIRLDIVNYQEGENSKLGYQVQGDDISGAGLLAPEQFYVSLSGNRVGCAKWVRSNGDVVESGNHANFLETDDMKMISLQARSDDTAVIFVNVSAFEVGLYELSFTFEYVAEGESRSQTTTGAICLYYER